MFIIETLIYVLIAFIMTFLAKRSNLLSLDNDTIQWNGFLRSYVAFFVIISAVRYNVGSDSLAYSMILKYGIPKHTLEVRSEEFLWVQFVEFITGYGIHFTIGMGIIVFLQIYFIIKGIKDYKHLLVSIPIILFAGRFYLELMNGMRQMLVACAFIYTLKWIVERKFWYYLLFVWIAHYVHNSALMLIPLYFIPIRFTLADKKKICLIVFLLCFVVGQTYILQGLTPYVKNFANLVGYQDYAGIVVTKLNDKTQMETMSFGITMISYFLMSLSVILFSDKLRDRFEGKIKYFNLWYNYSYFYSCGFFLFCNISHVFIRPLLYFELFLMLMQALIVNYCWYGEDNELLVKRFSNEIVCNSIIAINWVGLVWTLYRVISAGGWESIIYKTIFSYPV